MPSGNKQTFGTSVTIPPNGVPSQQRLPLRIIDQHRGFVTRLSSHSIIATSPPTWLMIPARKARFRGSSAASTVDPDRGKPEMEWTPFRVLHAAAWSASGMAASDMG